jgi:hypothetical protein
MAITPIIRPIENEAMEAFFETVTGAESTGSVRLAKFPIKFFSVAGTFGSATVVVQGSNDGTNWVTLTTEGTTALSFTSASGIKPIYENCKFIRLTTSGGTGTDLDAYIIAAR